MTLLGIDPATFRFVAQCLNHCAIARPRVYVCNLTYPTFKMRALYYSGIVVCLTLPHWVALSYVQDCFQEKVIEQVVSVLVFSAIFV
jgi:hypothetical protein